MDKGVVGLILILGAIVVIFFLIRPAYNQFVNLTSEKTSLKEQIATRQDYISKLKEVLSRLLSNASSATKLNLIIPDKPDLARIVYILNNVASESGLKIESISHVGIGSQSSKIRLPNQAENPQAELKYITLTVSLKGNYFSFRNFVSKIEKLARLFEIEKISFTVSTSSIFGQQPLSVLNFSVSLKAYTY